MPCTKTTVGALGGTIAVHRFPTDNLRDRLQAACGCLPEPRGRISEHITLQRLVSANMHTVTRAEMAIVLAEEGGIGILDRGFRPGADRGLREMDCAIQSSLWEAAFARRPLRPSLSSWQMRPLTGGGA